MLSFEINCLDAYSPMKVGHWAQRQKELASWEIKETRIRKERKAKEKDTRETLSWNGWYHQESGSRIMSSPEIDWVSLILCTQLSSLSAVFSSWFSSSLLDLMQLEKTRCSCFQRFLSYQPQGDLSSHLIVQNQCSTGTGTRAATYHDLDLVLCARNIRQSQSLQKPTDEVEKQKFPVVIPHVLRELKSNIQEGWEWRRLMGQESQLVTKRRKDPLAERERRYKERGRVHVSALIF